MSGFPRSHEAADTPLPLVAVESGLTVPFFRKMEIQTLNFLDVGLFIAVPNSRRRQLTIRDENVRSNRPLKMERCRTRVGTAGTF